MSGPYKAVNKGWNTLYSYEKGEIYLHLKNNDLLKLNFHLNGSLTDHTNLHNNQQIRTLNPPPISSTLFLLNGDLYGLIAIPGDESDKNCCGSGEISVVKYVDDDWDHTTLTFDFDAVSDTSFYESATILTSPSNNNTIYIYGGVCTNTGKITNRLLSVDFDTGKVSNITTPTKPQAFYGASNIWAPNVQSQLVIGGESSNGWLNMYQLATWDFNSGWSFKQISGGDKSAKGDNGGMGQSSTPATTTTMNSRTYPLTLPIFNPLPDTSSIFDDFKIEQVLLLGGDLEDQASTPQYAKLQMSTNDWAWNTSYMEEEELEQLIDISQVLGAATIFSTLVVINSTDNSYEGKRQNIDNYQINLYDVETLKLVQDLEQQVHASSNNLGTSSSSSESSKKTIILSTVLSLSFAGIIIGALVFFFLRRWKLRQQTRDDVTYNELDYKFDYLNPPTSLSHEPIYLNVNDSNSTLSGAASIDSWMKKRQDFDKHKLRSSYLASNETLNMVDDESEERQVTPESEQNEQRQQGEQGEHGSYSPNATVASLQSAYIQSASSHKRPHILKKSFSYTNTPLSSPAIRRKMPAKLKSLRTTNSEQFLGESSPSYSANPFDDPPKRSTLGEEQDNDGSGKDARAEEDEEDDGEERDSRSMISSIDGKMDVQVLVSSKRRSVLRIMNPDGEDEQTSLVSHIEERVENGAGEEDFDLGVRGSRYQKLRQRIPSEQKQIDE
ncbi:uncharacterized protein LODBEIA_P16190 [Lodderomyces beijingensis]|uniref:Galactose oxidase n=1 Tax=Lodderomyces beijingensis TaxID=1775926 RepID=A0ABP0ZM95_9ASCO